MPLRRRQAPTGSCTLILGFGGPIRLHGPAGPMIPTSFLAGMHLDAVITEFTGHQQGVQVDLTPLGTFQLLRRSLPELTNRTLQLDELAVPRAEPVSGNDSRGRTRRTPRVRTVATSRDCTPSQVALAWVLAKGPDLVPIPGTKHQSYLTENLHALAVELTPAEIAELDALRPAGAGQQMRVRRTAPPP